MKRNRLANVMPSCEAIGYFFFRLLNEAKPKKVFRLLQRLEGKLEIGYNKEVSGSLMGGGTPQARVQFLITDIKIWMRFWRRSVRSEHLNLC